MTSPPPDPERVKDAFGDAMDLDGGQRAAFLDALDRDEPRVAAEVRGLIEGFHGSGGRLFESAAAAPQGFREFIEGFWRTGAVPMAPVELPERADLAGAVVGGRYELTERLGEGSFGAVYKATDPLMRCDVAVKILDRYPGDDEQWVWREIGALLLLNDPAVTRLLGYGRFDGNRYVVTEIVAGEPFPGVAGPVPWGQVRGLLERCLEALVRIHAAGVVHGDIKPGNLLVRADGTPVFVDLGLSSGPGIDPESNAVRAGTPAYFAPEQLGDTFAEPTVQTDLYAFGVMAYHAVTARVPHLCADPAQMFVRRRSEPADRAPLVDAGVGDDGLAWFRRMLGVSPAERFENAADALASLRGERPPRDVVRGLWLPGRQLLVSRLVERLRSGESVDLRGRRGMGRSWVLRQVGAALREGGAAVRSVHPAQGDGASLRDAFGAPDGSEQELRAQFRRAVETGVVFIVDDHERVDAWTRSLLAEGRRDGCVLRAGSELRTAEIVLRPLEEPSLRTLFAGPDRVLHLAEDAARELSARTGGLPAAVMVELQSWVARGLAHIGDGVLSLDRWALDRLSAQPAVTAMRLESSAVAGLDARDRELLTIVRLAGRNAVAGVVSAVAGRPRTEVISRLTALSRVGVLVERTDGVFIADIGSALDVSPGEMRGLHSRLADALPHGTEGRAEHLSAAERGDEAQREVLEHCRRLRVDARVTRGFGAVMASFAMLRRSGSPVDTMPLLRELAELALEAGTHRGFELALVELGRREPDVPERERLVVLVQAAQTVVQGDARTGLKLLDAMGPLPHGLEFRRRSAIALALRVLRELDDYAGRIERWSQGEVDSGHYLAESRAWLAYLEGDFARAAELHEHVLTMAVTRSKRLGALLNAGSARLEEGHFDLAQQHGRRALDLARDARDPFAETRAEWLIRASAYRAGRAHRWDRELVAAIAGLPTTSIHPLVLLTEAAVAWRADEHETSVELALRCAALFGAQSRNPGALIGRALAAAAGDEGSRAEAAEHLAAICTCPLPGITLQVRALHALHLGIDAVRDREGDLALAGQLPADKAGLRREILSVAECLDAVGV